MNEGTLSLVLDILGTELKQDVKADFAANEEAASITGKFDLDLTSLEVPGLQANEDGSQISPVISFELDLNLNKK